MGGPGTWVLGGRVPRRAPRRAQAPPDPFRYGEFSGVTVPSPHHSLELQHQLTCLSSCPELSPLTPDDSAAPIRQPSAPAPVPGYLQHTLAWPSSATGAMYPRRHSRPCQLCTTSGAVEPPCSTTQAQVLWCTSAHQAAHPLTRLRSSIDDAQLVSLSLRLSLDSSKLSPEPTAKLWSQAHQAHQARAPLPFPALPFHFHFRFHISPMYPL